MARGPKKHYKRINAPKHWMLDKLGGIFVSREGGRLPRSAARCGRRSGHRRTHWRVRDSLQLGSGGRGRLACCEAACKQRGMGWRLENEECNTPDPVPPAALDAQAPKPSPGPHKQRDCLPLIIILRNRLK